ncbi:hypothetical protein N0V86_002340 [Didymella sp. IMI 355093]|nr:hypothetical protein N0V86_002340 [Didymella sp. IMI 355093]
MLFTGDAVQSNEKDISKNYVIALEFVDYAIQLQDGSDPYGPLEGGFLLVRGLVIPMYFITQVMHASLNSDPDHYLGVVNFDNISQIRGDRDPRNERSRQSLFILGLEGDTVLLSAVHISPYYEENSPFRLDEVQDEEF